MFTKGLNDVQKMSESVKLLASQPALKKSACHRFWQNDMHCHCNASQSINSLIICRTRQTHGLLLPWLDSHMGASVMCFSWFSLWRWILRRNKAITAVLLLIIHLRISTARLHFSKCLQGVLFNCLTQWIQLHNRTPNVHSEVKLHIHALTFIQCFTLLTQNQKTYARCEASVA